MKSRSSSGTQRALNRPWACDTFNGQRQQLAALGARPCSQTSGRLTMRPLILWVSVFFFLGDLLVEFARLVAVNLWHWCRCPSGFRPRS
jgi:hypothetical protein